MQTRFDIKHKWKTADGRELLLEDMETSHLMNILNMFITKPKFTVSMIIKDIEDAMNYEVWGNKSTIKQDSIRNITSLPFEEVVDYSLTSALGRGIRDELSNRGVNVTNYILQIKGEQ